MATEYVWPVPNVSASSAAVGTVGAAVPTSADMIGVKDGSGNLQPVTQGQAAMAASLPVVIASNQTSIPVAATLQAGSAIAGKVGIDQTTPGTTNGVQINAALPAGANVIGHVINDAGSAIMGKVGIDQTAPGTTNGVQVVAALPAGSNAIGTVKAQLQDNAGTAVVVGPAAAAASLPVTLSNENVQDLFFTGQAAQTATVNNIIPAAVSANATDLTGYRSGSVQIISTGTGGTVIFEGSNDNTNFQTIPVWSQLILTGTPIVAAITATSSNLIYVFPVMTRYVRVRIATTITGGTVQAVSKFSQVSFAPGIQQVAQATAANLNATVTATNLSTNNAQINGVVPLMGNGVTGTGSLRVTLASDTSSNTNAFLVSEEKSATGTLSNVASSATTVTLLASNASRKQATFFNDSTQTLYMKFGATASLTSYTVQIPANGYYELPGVRVYTGIIDGIWASANGNLRVTELT